MVDTLTYDQTLQELDTILELLGYHYGPPLGAGQFHITTEQPVLKDLLTNLNPPTHMIEDDSPWVGDNGEIWSIYRSWRAIRNWRGKSGKVVILKRERLDKTVSYKIVFLPESRAEERFNMSMHTLSMRKTFADPKAELNAQKRLFATLTQEQKSLYIVGDSFLEIGKSGVVYWLRKSKPTLALRYDEGSESLRPLCALCLHPVAYYTYTWAGVLPPSDEVLTHLLMIRASEHFYWKKANQIPIEETNSGV